jgi:hypothetical protein
MNSFNILGENVNYKFDDIKSFMEIEVDTDLDDMVRMNNLQEKLVLGEISPEQIVFISVDSNVVCKYDILEEMPKVRNGIKATLNIENPVIVFIDTFVSKTENAYKLSQRHKYAGVDFTNLENYFKFINEETMFFDDSCVDYIHTVDEKYACAILDDEEDDYFYNGGQCHRGSGARQEINDNAQLSILLRFRDSIVGSNVVFLTFDKALQKKCKNNNVYVSLS